MSNQSFLTQVEQSVRNILETTEKDNQSSPVVIFSSAFPFLKEMNRSDRQAVEDLLDSLLNGLGHRLILMPTFTQGFVNGICNLDISPSTTGTISEAFRKRPNVKRTLSAFFSYAFIGPGSEELVDLIPLHAWGEHSIYEWMEKKNVIFLLFGTHPTHCSYIHRFEWLCRENISFRFNKTFHGTLIRNSQEINWNETLFVRNLNPPVINDFTGLENILSKTCMKQIIINGIPISSYTSQQLLTYVLPIIQNDPFSIVKNRADYEGHQHGKERYISKNL